MSSAGSSTARLRSHQLRVLVPNHQASFIVARGYVYSQVMRDIMNVVPWQALKDADPRDVLLCIPPQGELVISSEAWSTYLLDPDFDAVLVRLRDSSAPISLSPRQSPQPSGTDRGLFAPAAHSGRNAASQRRVADMPVRRVRFASRPLIRELTPLGKPHPSPERVSFAPLRVPSSAYVQRVHVWASLFMAASRCWSAADARAGRGLVRAVMLWDALHDWQTGPTTTPELTPYMSYVVEGTLVEDQAAEEHYGPEFMFNRHICFAIFGLQELPVEEALGAFGPLGVYSVTVCLLQGRDIFASAAEWRMLVEHLTRIVRLMLRVARQPLTFPRDRDSTLERLLVAEDSQKTYQGVSVLEDYTHN